VGLVRLARRARTGGPAGRFLGDWYPMLLLAALYGEIGVLTLDAGFQNDLAIQRLEAWVFRSQVSYRWIREMPAPWLSVVLHTCYLAYYAILYAAPIGLWLSGRRDAARHTILGVMVTFYLCYAVFLFSRSRAALCLRPRAQRGDRSWSGPAGPVVARSR
jgi:hypothetical protein